MSQINNQPPHIVNAMLDLVKHDIDSVRFHKLSTEVLPGFNEVLINTYQSSNWTPLGNAHDVVANYKDTDGLVSCRIYAKVWVNTNLLIEFESPQLGCGVVHGQVVCEKDKAKGYKTWVTGASNEKILEWLQNELGKVCQEFARSDKVRDTKDELIGRFEFLPLELPIAPGSECTADDMKQHIGDIVLRLRLHAKRLERYHYVTGCFSAMKRSRHMARYVVDGHIVQVVASPTGEYEITIDDCDNAQLVGKWQRFGKLAKFVVTASDHDKKWPFDPAVWAIYIKPWHGYMVSAKSLQYQYNGLRFPGDLPDDMPDSMSGRVIYC